MAVQGLRAVGRAWLAPAACVALAACSNPLNGPIDLFHDLQGGEIAAHRPPPPGLGQPYPKLGSTPPRPVVANAAYRQALEAQLATERDRAERVAADRPIDKVPPPPPPQPAPLPAAATGSTLPKAGGPVAGPDEPQAPATAMLQTAEAPSAPPAGPIKSTLADVPTSSGPSADLGPAPGTPVTIAGAAPTFANLPEMPEQPPAPATFEGVAAEPAPTPQRLPARLPPPASGTPVFFPAASAALPSSQLQALKDVVSRRRNQTVEILGLGDASSDTPEGQATAVALGLARAQAVATELVAMHVPPGSLRLGADAFGRGAVLRLLP